ncbi:MAG: hypothetical protein HY002_00920 [Candidatus Rokubacteria bacterium]|nr:hypothetical protein [Candidatus Rokubacteria bacterium]
MTAFRGFGVGVILLIVILAVTNSAHVGFAQQAGKIRWDIVTFTSFSPPSFKEGGVAVASATDGSLIKLTGSGTFGPGESDPVTGGGTWETFDVSNKSTGSGKYTVTGLVSFQQAPGTLPPAIKDQIGQNADARAGLAVLRTAYANTDGSAGGTGILVVSCHLPVDSPHEIFEGVIASKGFVTYFNRVLTMPGVDANRTAFHR